MARKDVEVIQGDTFNMGFRVSGIEGPIDFTAPDTIIYAQITDASGRKVVEKFEIEPTAPEVGEFRIHLDADTTAGLRGKHLWSVRYERGPRVVTLAGGEFVVKVSP